ncbi:MAG: S41 family peptidase [Bacteroidia bacterium]|nr:S41 family peptidase [Bacteroidia bacterium]
MNRIFLLAIFVLISTDLFSQSFWKIENEYGDEILLTIVLDNQQKTFKGYTRKNALKDIAGSFTYTLANVAGKLKYAEIVYIEGKTQSKNDSLLLTGTFNYFDKQYPFSAAIADIHFKGKYIDNRNRPRPLTGIKMPDSKPIKDYPLIINSAFSLTEKNLFNSEWLKSDEWLDFRIKINELKSKISDDYELAAAFFWIGKKLPFSPFQISKTRPNNRSTGRRNPASIREVKTNTAVLNANSLPANQKEMDSIAVIVDKKRYTNLIIDLRGNNKISPGVAAILLNYLSDKAFNAGVYLTRKWFDSNSMIPKGEDYKKLFKDFNDTKNNAGELYKEPGRYLNIVPQGKSYKGKVYVLADSKTSNVSEALVYVLKNNKIATIIGQKTSGATILDEHILINDEFDLILPVSDYYTFGGKSLNKIGIEPDITVSGEDALKYALTQPAVNR